MNKNQKEFLEGGIIEDYCLGIANAEDTKKLLALCKQFPEAQAYLEKNRKTIKGFEEAYSKKPSALSKSIIRNRILDNLKLKKLKLVGPEQMLPEFINISRHSKVEDWEALLSIIEEPQDFENIFVKPLFVSEKEELILVWAKNEVPDETHEDMEESFLILDGTVDCYVEDQVFSMERGDFMQIPLHLNHKVVVTSTSPGKAIRSRILI